MPLPVVNNALLQCPGGTFPTPMTVLPTNRVMINGQPAATKMDNVPFLNIKPFGPCKLLPNPPTATLTASAAGVLTPGPCVPVFAAPWMPGAVTVKVGGIELLDSTCKLQCMHGGTVSVVLPGSTTVMNG